MFKRFFNKGKETDTTNNRDSEEKIPSMAAIPSEEKTEPVKEEFEINKVDWMINDSTLTFMPRELFMHYWDGTTTKDLQDPSWQNQGVYFWTEKEPFENKSLPGFFENMNKKLFVLNQAPDYITMVSARAIPWFGMPGGGEKMFFRYDENTPVTLEEAHKLDIIRYVEFVELKSDNLSILNDRENYCFLIDPNEVKFENRLFYLNGEKISLAALYHQKKLLILAVE